MEENIQRLLRLAPREIRHLMIACALSGLALNSLHRIFHPLLDPLLAQVINPSNISAWDCTFTSLFIIAPVWFAMILRKSNAVSPVLNQIDLIEAAMERVGLPERERMTVRRGEIKALADAAKQNFGQATAVNLVDVANQERPGLIEDTVGAQPGDA